MDEDCQTHMKNEHNITELYHFRRLLGVTMNDIASRFSNAPFGAKKSFQQKKPNLWNC